MSEAVTPEAASAAVPRTGDVCFGTGRRKSSVARVRLVPGSGQITINRRPLEEYFSLRQHQSLVLAPLEKTGRRNHVDVSIRVVGGGGTGQAEACRLAIARALKASDPDLSSTLREAGFLTCDSRVKERKKYGLHGARRGTQFSKR